jgi:arsenate reductase-like glutaredoxin family protein
VRKLSKDARERNYAKDPLQRPEIDAIVKAAGSVGAVLNTRHATAKAHGWKDKAPAKSTFIKAALAEPNLLRRPILLKGSRAVVGRDEDAIRKLLR